jgi:uncharacterized glyoxalase superfamily protein PhnB
MSRPNIFPALRYNDAHAAIDFLVRAFGFERHAVFEGPDNTVSHAELRFGAGALAINSVTPPDPANPWTNVRQGLYVVLADVNAHYDRSSAAGADVVRLPVDMDYGSREYSVRDPEGHMWSFGTYDMAASDGAPTIFPELQYREGQRAIRFLRRAFGFEPTLEVPGESGSILHAELRLTDNGRRGVVMLGSTPEAEALYKGQRQCANVHVADPDALFTRATKAGAAVVQPPNDTSYGARACSLRDPEGFLWGFSTYAPK